MPTGNGGRHQQDEEENGKYVESYNKEIIT